MLDTRIVHEDVAAPGLLDQRAAILALRHVSLDVTHLDAVLLGQILGQLVVVVAVGERVQHDVGAGARQFMGDAKADARCGPGDDRCLAGKHWKTSYVRVPGP